MYKPTLQFIVDGVDLTDRIRQCTFSYGLSGIANPDSLNRLTPSGSITLRDYDKYWTDDRIDALNELEVFADGISLFTCAITDGQRESVSRLLQAKLVSVNEKSYADPIEHTLVSETDEAGLLEAIDMTITPYTGWSGMRVHDSEEINGTRSSVVNRFAIWADASVFEDHEGVWRAFS